MADNDALSSLTDSVVDKFMKERDGRICHMFHGFIKESFLSKTCTEITASNDFKNILMKDVYGDVFDFNTVNRTDFRYDIAENVALTHWYWCLPIKDEQERAKKYSDTQYIVKLKNQAIVQCRLRPLLSEDRRVAPYAHVPILFSMHCIISVMGTQLNEYLFKVKKISSIVDNFEYLFYTRSIETANSILLLIESGDTYNSYSLLRSLIELLFVYLAIHGNKDAINEYSKLINYRQEYEMNGDFPEEYKKEYPKDYKNLNFLSYGWLRILEPEKHDFKYSFSEVIDHSQIPEAAENGMWLKMYKRCCKFVHGNLIFTEHPEMALLELSNYLATILYNIANFYTKHYKKDLLYDGIDIKAELGKQREKLSEISKSYDKSNFKQ